MADQFYNPFQGIDVSVPEQYREDFNRYCQTSGAKSIIDQSPFPRMVDLWFLAVCVAVKKGLKPVDSNKYKTKETYKIIDGNIFNSDSWRIQALMLIAIAKEGNIEIVAEPRKMMALTNGLAVAGLPYVIEMLKDGDDDTIWNLSESAEALIIKNENI
jgi:hypothetical protein